MQLSTSCRTLAFEQEGKQQLVTMAVAQALEIIPKQLILNAGLECTALMAQLRKCHVDKKKNSGVALDEGIVVDTFETFVWEPELVKKNCLKSAIEAACLILSIDETVKNPESAPPQQGLPGRQ